MIMPLWCKHSVAVMFAVVMDRFQSKECQAQKFGKINRVRPDPSVISEDERVPAGMALLSSMTSRNRQASGVQKCRHY